MRNEVAAQDAKRYVNSMMQYGGGAICLTIERKYGLNGYPPEIVMIGLRAAERGENVHDAIRSYLNLMMHPLH